jgi:hypothetical protein
MRISKSQFVAGVQCLKRLYWQVHQPEFGAKRDAATEATMEQGREVGLLARQLFPGGVEVSGSEGLTNAIWATRELIGNPEIPAIFEGVFECHGVLVKADILQRRRENSWRLFEVKSTTDSKPHHYYDVGIQSRVISASGLKLSSTNLMHVNRSYVFGGGSIDTNQFFHIKNLNRQIREVDPEITFQSHEQFRILTLPTMPEIGAGRQCSHPMRCEFFDRCNLPRPDDHIGYLPLLHASAIEKLGDLGIESICDIPDDFPLSERQRRACTSVQSGEPWYSTELHSILATLKYPVFFMDFETVNPAIPRFSRMHPYDPIPFQWSVHVLRCADALAEHFEFLADDHNDPRPEFIASLCMALEQSGSIVVYNQQFESQRLSELATCLPEFAERIAAIQSRLWDLLPVIRNHVYHPAFAGSFSLKAVLPALVPDMSYEGTEVADGQAAGLAWEAVVRGGLDCDQCDSLRKALLAYCAQDTVAMVKLLDNLRLFGQTQ